MLGWLRFEDSYYRGSDGRGAHVCLLMPDDTTITDPLVQLYRAKIVKVEKRGILIRGEEDHWRRKERTTHMQTLWCWPAAQDRVTMSFDPEARAHAWDEMRDAMA